VDEPPDNSYYVLSKSLEVCGKCNKKCTNTEQAIQCDLSCMWVHALCEGITEEQYNSIVNLSTVVNTGCCGAPTLWCYLNTLEVSLNTV